MLIDWIEQYRPAIEEHERRRREHAEESKDAISRAEREALDRAVVFSQKVAAVTKLLTRDGRLVSVTQYATPLGPLQDVNPTTKTYHDTVSVAFGGQVVLEAVFRHSDEPQIGWPPRHAPKDSLRIFPHWTDQDGTTYGIATWVDFNERAVAEFFLAHLDFSSTAPG